ncbi:unnamed protein product [Miscanthus lutarioriparius]|uniref:Uncharacterized protein n=1 Tax=Miscanthus lutarioriparius TaxID=422564 RepID=A0A811QT37_9POAL|nr:unnamed protein product [Miscanthus lutarioriparius]
MALAPVDVLPIEGGFMAAAEVIAEVVGAKAALAADVAAAVAPASGPMRWNNNTSGFVLRRMAQLLSDGTRPNKVFKEKDVNLVAKCLKDYNGDADHPKDAEFLNCPMRFYSEMEAIFGHSMATGRYALGSGEALGVNQADSTVAKVEGFAFHHVPKEKTNTKVGEGRQQGHKAAAFYCGWEEEERELH